MVGNVIGFIGSDKYDLILYLSRILLHLGKKVLLVDYAESEALYQCIPIPEILREDNRFIDYRGIDFIQGQYYKSNMRQQYDAVLIDLGFNDENEIMLQCTKVLYVTDLQLHNVRRIKNLENIKNINKYVVIKDVFQCKIKPEFILEELGQGIDMDHVYILYQDSLDLKYKIHSQYNHRFSFGKLSRPTKYFLKDIVKQMDHNLNEKRLNNAYRKAERGK